MATISAPVTPAEFDLLDPEGRFELLNGEVIEMPSASGPHNYLAGTLKEIVGTWLRQHALGVILQETEFRMGDCRFRPDEAIVLMSRWKRIGFLPAPLPEPPHIAIEVVSPSESAFTLDQKIAAYLEAGVNEVWVLYYATERMLIYTPGNVRMLERDATIQTPLLPGWSLAMSELLSKEDGVYF
jgi:Uma2 family endonuclease